MLCFFLWGGGRPARIFANQHCEIIIPLIDKHGACCCCCCCCFVMPFFLSLRRAALRALLPSPSFFTLGSIQRRLCDWVIGVVTKNIQLEPAPRFKMSSLVVSERSVNEHIRFCVPAGIVAVKVLFEEKAASMM